MNSYTSCRSKFLDMPANVRNLCVNDVVVLVLQRNVQVCLVPTRKKLATVVTYSLWLDQSIRPKFGLHFQLLILCHVSFTNDTGYDT